MNEPTETPRHPGPTGIPTRCAPRAFQKTINERILQADRTGAPFSLVLLRVDDPNGEVETDEAPPWEGRVAQALEGRTREGDLVLRLGHGRFALVVDAAGEGTADRFTEAIHARLRPTDDAATALPRRVWVGRATYPGTASTVAELVNEARKTFWASEPSGDELGPSPESAEAVSVLVVDDDPNVRDVVGGVLADHAYRVESVDGGAAALLAMGREPRPVVLLDLAMPGLDGVELLTKIQSFCRETRVVVLVDARDARTLAAGLDAGAVAAVPKPIESPAEVLAAVNRAAAAWRLEINRTDHLAHLEAENQRMRHELELARELGSRDEETGLLHARSLGEILGREVYRARRHHRTFTLVEVAVSTPSRGGAEPSPPDAGTLRAVATTLRDGTRRSDVVARSGPDAFTLLLPETSPDDGITYATRLLERLTGARGPGTDPVYHLGVALFPSDAGDDADLAERARAAALRARENGPDTLALAREMGG